MSFQLRREELLDGEQLRAMLAENPGRAAQAILIAAKQGLIDGQALLGQILLDGQGIERDPVLARRWFQIAANAGHLMARNMLGRCLEHGWGGPVDLTLASLQYRQAAEAGLDWAMYNYANLLATGRGVPEDPLAALALYRQAAEVGHAKALKLLGRYLEEGQYCAQDLNAAWYWYKCSAENGDFRGQFSHAAVLTQQGQIDEALEWLYKALAGGNLNFLRVAQQSLMYARDPRIRALASDFAQRAAQLQTD